MLFCQPVNSHHFPTVVIMSSVGAAQRLSLDVSIKQRSLRAIVSPQTRPLYFRSAQVKQIFEKNEFFP